MIYEAITDVQFDNAYNSANPWFVLLYMEAFLIRWDELIDDEKRKAFISEIYDGGDGPDANYIGTATRVNSLYRILRSGRIVDALERIVSSEKSNKDFNEVYLWARSTLNAIRAEKYKLPWD